MTDREFWVAVRQALFMLIYAIERYKLEMNKTTSEIRKENRLR
jgi:hypothetical protein